MRSRRTIVIVLASVLALVAVGCLPPPPGTKPIASAPSPSGCITDVGPAERLEITGCGGDITYDVSVPPQCMTNACGLILDVHGWTMTGDDQEANTGIAAIGRAEGYIVVQPTSANKAWGSLRYPHVADFVELAVQVWRVDRRWVHATGFSQGAVMTWWMRCNRADLFASAAPAGYAGTACTNGARPVPTLYVQGEDDYFVSAAATQATIDDMIATHGLGPGSVTDEVPGAYTRTRYTNDDGFVFETIIHSHTNGNLGGHCILGSLGPASIYGCDEVSPLAHGRAVVDFFRAHPKT